MDQTICGGWGPTKEATEDIHIIVNQVRTDVEGKTNQKYETYKAHKYRSQVVAGMNYLIKVHVGGDLYIHLLVYQNLSRETELSGVEENHSKDDPLETFKH